MHIISLVTDNNPSWMIQRKGGEWPQKLFHDQSPRKYGTGPGSTRDPWICSQLRICNQTGYRLRYAARSYIYVSYDKKHSVTMTWKSPFACPGMPNPLHFIKSFISWKLFRSPPINHIYSCFLWQDTFNSTNREVPPGSTTSFPPVHIIKDIISGKTYRSPPINHV